MITPCFEVVGGGNYAIDSLTLEGVNDCDATVQIVNADGSWGAQGFWFNAWGDLPAGWFTDGLGTTAADISLKPGQAVFFYTTSEAAKAMSAGQVSGNIEISLDTGYSMIGNASPVAISIDEILLTGVNDCDATVQIVNADGSWGTQGFWFNAWGDLPAGWFTDGLGTTPAEITLEPGQSVFFYTTASGAKATVPSALAQ
ncbi:MAG: hypothetical protein J6S51_01485 [Kiritimatiellae bacterium]|nr:hypothetical protein [Kiritimatiellia bacterium]